MYHGVPRTGNIISPENTKIPQSSNGAPGGFLRRAEAARATEFHEDRRTATMNISPGPRIIIRNEIALESLISHRAANAVALRIREPQVRRRRLRFFTPRIIVGPDTTDVICFVLEAFFVSLFFACFFHNIHKKI